MVYISMVNILRRKIPVLYLPKSAPPVPALLAFPVPSLESLPERVRAIELKPVWPKTCEAQALASIDLPAIHVRLSCAHVMSEIQ